MSLQTRLQQLALTVFLCLYVIGCAEKPEHRYTIAINPWPGYELLYLAQQRGYFDQVSLNVDLIELSSLADAHRAFANGRVDGFTSTIVEAVMAQASSQQKLKVVLVADYSNGGDVIVTNKRISSLAELKGRRVGCEMTSLGIVVLYKALQKVGLNIMDVELINVEQRDGYEAMKNEAIDAFVTYPPTLMQFSKDPDFTQIFSTKEIPGEVVDVVSVSQTVLEQESQFVPKLLSAWQMAFEYTKAHPKEAYAQMALREAISAEDFEAVFTSEVQVFDREQSIAKLRDPKTTQTLVEICALLDHLEYPGTDCSLVNDMVFAGSFE